MKVRLGILGLYFTLNLYAQSPSPFVSREDQNAQASSEIVEHLLDTLSFAELEKDTSKIIHTTNKLVIRYALMKNFDRAADLAKQNLELAVKYDNQCLLGQTYNHLAIYLGSNKVYEKVTNQPLPGFFKWADSAIYYFRKSTEVLVDDQCELNPVGWGYAGMMRQYFFKARMSHKQFDTALYYAEKARLNAEKYDDLELLQGYNVWTARCYNHMGQYELAKAHIRQAYEIAIERNRDFRGIYDIWFGTLVKEAGNDSLLWLHHEIVERNQNLAGAEMQMAIQNADRKYETSKKEQELRTKDQQLETRERIIGIGVISLILILSLSLYLFLLYKKNQKLSKRNELLLKEQNHRVKNNLQMISSLLSLQSQKLLSADAKDALNNSQLRVNSVALLHRMLYEGDHFGEVNLKEYIGSLVEEIRFSVHRVIQAELDIDKNLSLKVEQSTSLGLIINELITNSAKHIPAEVEVKIHLTVKREVGKIGLKYADNGPGVDPEVWKRSASFGNQLIRIQSEQLNGSYEILKEDGFKYELKIGA